MKKKINILLVIGGMNNEHQVSLNGGEIISNSLSRKKYNLSVAVITKNGKWKIFEKCSNWNRKKIPDKKSLNISRAIEKILKLNIDTAYINIHGKNGEDGTLQGFFTTLGINYTGSGILSSALAMNKKLCNQIFSINSLNVPWGRLISVKEWKNGRKHITSELLKKPGIPMVIKPNEEGSSIGVDIVFNKNELESKISKIFREHTSLYTEEFIKGTEVTCGVIYKNKKFIPLPPTEIVPLKGVFFDYTAKYEVGATDEITPARINIELTRKVQKIALIAHKLLGCGSQSRTDMIITGTGKKKKIFVLEINTIPGMTETSLLPQQAKSAGIS
ncbi:MAG: D-alanine--D-alanine ligase, partial [Actinomycetia bacterium]|nr:D-alanine--D-alanine ligase [Actinomycetes bacterium]